MNQKNPTNSKTAVYSAPWIVNAVGQNLGTIAIGSYLEGQKNYIRVLQMQQGAIHELCTIERDNPVTQLRWTINQLLISAGPEINIWKYEPFESELTHKTKFVPDSDVNYQGPSLAFDFSPSDPNHICTTTLQAKVSCSLDGTVSILDLEKEKTNVQVVVHKESVSDIALGPSPHTFTTVSLDGSCRWIDQRHLTSNTQVYKSSKQLLHVACCQKNEYNIAVSGVDEQGVIIYFDVRKSDRPKMITKHNMLVTQLQFNPNRPSQLCSSSDDGMMYLWTLKNDNTEIMQPFSSSLEINNFCWDTNDRLGVTYNQYYACVSPKI